MAALAARLLLFLYGVLGVANIARGVQAFRLAPVLASAEPTPSLSVLGGVYIFWGVVLLGIGVACWQRTSALARWILRVSALAYQVTVWIIHLVGDKSAYARSLRGRDLMLTILFLAVVFVFTAFSQSRASAPRRVNRK